MSIDLRELQMKHQILEEDYKKQGETLEVTRKELQKYKAATAALQREEASNKSEISSLRERCESLESSLEDAITYSRKLEHRFKMQKLSNYTSDLNFHLQERLNVLRSENESLVSQLKASGVEKASSQEKIKVLTASLKVKGDPKSLYQNASMKEDIKKLTSKLYDKRQMFKKTSEELELALTRIEELELINDSNNKEMERLETENFTLIQEIQGIRKNNQGLAKERASLLESKDNINASQKKYEQELKSFADEMTRMSESYKKENIGQQGEIERLTQNNAQLVNEMREQELLLNEALRCEQNARKELEQVQDEFKKQVEANKLKDREIVILRGKRTQKEEFSRDRFAQVSQKFQTLSKTSSEMKFSRGLFQINE